MNHWIEHAKLEECFVLTARALRRAIRDKRHWTTEAQFAYEAFYHPKTGYAELNTGELILFSDLVVRLLGQATAATT